MRKIVKKTVLWQCKTCCAEYEKKSDAEQCERMQVEEQKFKVGDCVTNCMELRKCPSFAYKEYQFKGKVSKVFGPESPDEEYWIKWLGGLPKTHVFWYEVAYVCPLCKRNKNAAGFAPELALV